MTTLFNQYLERRKRQRLRNTAPSSEIILWEKLRRSQLNGFKFRRQTSVGRYVVDFYCPKMRLVIELDGASHSTSEARAYDKIREEYLKALGLKILRFTNQDVNQRLSLVLKAIKNHLTSSPSLRRRGLGGG